MPAQGVHIPAFEALDIFEKSSVPYRLLEY
jgi:hypothetical protein